MASFAKYSLVPTDDPKENAVPTQAQVPGAFDFKSAFNYKSAFDYDSKTSSKAGKDRFKDWSLMSCLSGMVTGLSYLFICLTFPITLWFCWKKIQQWERLIVFRLGRLRGALGPGIVFIIPWLDRHNRVDMRTKAFSVPPQQLITSDNGIIEMGCEVKYRISDVQRLTTSVTTPEHGMRSFGKTVMLNVLTKHTVRETERDRPLIASQILKELNNRVLEWGIEIGDVSLSNVNILKEAEPHNPLKQVMSCFGGGGGGGGGGKGPEIVSPPGATAAAASAILNMPGFPAMGDFSFVNSAPSKKKSEAMVTSSRAPDSKLGKYLQSMISAPGGNELTHGIYRLQVEGKDGGIFIIFIGNGVRQVVEGDLPKVTPDVAVVIAKNDLMAIFEGTLAPLQAYLSGHLTVQGNIQMLMGLESLRQTTKDPKENDIYVV